MALHAHALLRRDVDSIVRDGRIQLVDASRGRVARRQRWPDGLHAAVEARGVLAASATGEILDSITVESLVRRYPRVCGMTATAVAVGEELREFYGLEVAVVPPNRPCVREDRPSRLYATVAEKGEGRSAGEVAAAHATGRPVLIGTLDIAESERIAHRLSLAGLGCAVLNAKNDAEEAAIVAGGRRVRGHHRVDADGRARHRAIRLGGREGDHGQVAALGGLRVIGTGRCWSSKARQPAARAVRPPGRPPVAPVFFASMEDQLVEHYAPDADPPRGAAADGSVADPGRTGRSITRSGWPKTPTWRSTATPGAAASSSRTSGAWCSSSGNRVLTTGAARRALARRCPQRYAELSATVSPEVLDDAARQSRPLPPRSRLGGPSRRAGRHPRGHSPARARPRPQPAERVPPGGGHAVLAPAPRRRGAIRRDLQAVPITDSGADLVAVGLKRPTATWTYLVQDNPFRH